MPPSNNDILSSLKYENIKKRFYTIPDYGSNLKNNPDIGAYFDMQFWHNIRLRILLGKLPHLKANSTCYKTLSTPDNIYKYNKFKNIYQQNNVENDDMDELIKDISEYKVITACFSKHGNVFLPKNDENLSSGEWSKLFFINNMFITIDTFCEIMRTFYK